MGQQSLFETKRGGRIVPRAEPHMSDQFDEVDRRSPIAKELGIEF